MLAPYSSTNSATPPVLSATDAEKTSIAGPQKAADGVFVCEATSVTFVNATSMVLSGLPNNTAYVQYPPRVEAGTFDTVISSSRHPAAPVAIVLFRRNRGHCRSTALTCLMRSSF